MPVRQSPPGRGGEQRAPHFVHVKTAQGEQWHAYCAGPCQWYDCHAKGRTKPCLHKVTGGELVCEKCSPLNPVERIGYQPLFRQLDSKPCFVVVHETVEEQVSALRHLSRVIVGRGEDKSDGVYVIPALNPDPRFQSAVAWKLRPIDLLPSLLRVWGMPELQQWAALDALKSDNALSLPQPVAAPGEQPADVEDDTVPPAVRARLRSEEFYQKVRNGEIKAPVGIKPPTNGKPKK